MSAAGPISMLCIHDTAQRASFDRADARLRLRMPRNRACRCLRVDLPRLTTGARPE
jgi:hypothetical protein